MFKYSIFVIAIFIVSVQANQQLRHQDELSKRRLSGNLPDTGLYSAVCQKRAPSYGINAYEMKQKWLYENCRVNYAKICTIDHYFDLRPNSDTKFTCVKVEKTGEKYKNNANIEIDKYILGDDGFISSYKSIDPCIINKDDYDTEMGMRTIDLDEHENDNVVCFEGIKYSSKYSSCNQPSIYCEDNVIKLCPEGSFCKYGVKKKCDAGYYCPEGSSEQKKCDPGTYCPAGSSKQKQCDAGYYCPSPSEQKQCDAGTFSNTRGATSNKTCKECDAGYYCPAGSPEAEICPPGYTCPSPSEKIECPEGHFCIGGIKRECFSQEFQNKTGQSKCEPCGTDKYKNAKGDGCVSDQPAFTKAYKGNDYRIAHWDLFEYEYLTLNFEWWDDFSVINDAFQQTKTIIYKSDAEENERCMLPSLGDRSWPFRSNEHGCNIFKSNCAPGFVCLHRGIDYNEAGAVFTIEKTQSSSIKMAHMIPVCRRYTSQMCVVEDSGVDKLKLEHYNYQIVDLDDDNIRRYNNDWYLQKSDEASQTCRNTCKAQGNECKSVPLQNYADAEFLRNIVAEKYHLNYHTNFLNYKKENTFTCNDGVCTGFHNSKIDCNTPKSGRKVCCCGDYCPLISWNYHPQEKEN